MEEKYKGSWRRSFARSSAGLGRDEARNRGKGRIRIFPRAKRYLLGWMPPPLVLLLRNETASVNLAFFRSLSRIRRGFYRVYEP